MSWSLPFGFIVQMLTAVQGRKPAEEARPHLERSLEQARSLGAQFEVALTLKAMADTRHPIEGDPEAEHQKIFDQLGVVSVPSPPLP